MIIRKLDKSKHFKTGIVPKTFIYFTGGKKFGDQQEYKQRH